MGRNSGFIAMQASLASGQVDICLIPEVLLSFCYYFQFPTHDWWACSKTYASPSFKVPFNLHGPNGVLKHLKYLIETKGSAVICVAEGAGQVTIIIQSQLRRFFIQFSSFSRRYISTYVSWHFVAELPRENQCQRCIW